jgi:lipopolysaccharide/colanic/teichoic acid biosynthesis glycosyltransferase
LQATSEARAGFAAGDRQSPPLAQRIRFQLGGGLVASTLLPGLYRWQESFFRLDHGNIRNALIGAGLAIFCGFFVNRRVGDFPGVKAGSSILVSYTGAFALVMLAFFFGRLEYSRYMFVMSYIVALIWFVGIHLSTANSRLLRLAVIPGGDAESLLSLPRVSWQWLKEPALPPGAVSGIAADLRHGHSPQWERFLADCALAGMPVYHYKQLAESLTGKVEIEHLSENTFGSILPDLLYLRAKRVIDFVIAAAVLPVFLVLAAVIGPLVIYTAGRPVFFRQKRVGHGGRIFRVYKFRTMLSGTGSSVIGDAVTPEERDRKITPLGRFLRRHRIDELPQVLNILRGEMSWIGPRPEALTLSRWYEAELPFYRYRHVVPPGITGWAQVNQGHVAEPGQVLEKLHYDFFYIKNLSPWLDLLIALKTVRIIVSGAGAR